MSVGHRGHHGGLDERKIEDMLDDERVRKALKRIKGASVNEDYEIPYTGGISDDGKTVYIDRDLPESVKVGGKAINPRPFIFIHETTEKAVVDTLDEHYDVAHDVATYAERKAVEKAGLRWRAYQDALEPFIKADEKDKVEDIPPDLDLYPYADDPILLGQIKRAQGAS